MTTIAASTKEKALSTLDNMAEIVKMEMLVHGHYAESVITKPERVGKAICNGQRYCALGTMYISYGVRPNRTEEQEVGDKQVKVIIDLPGTGRGGRHGREQFTEHRPGLGLVYRTLKRLSQEYAMDHGYGPEKDPGETEEERNLNMEYWREDFDIETLFESCLGPDEDDSDYDEAASYETRQVMLDLVAAARKEIEGLPVAQR